MHQFISSSSLLKLKMGLYNFFMAVYDTTKNKFQQRRNRLLFSVFLLGKERCTFWWGLKMGNVYVMTSIKLAMNQIENCNFKFTIRASRLWSGPTTPWFSLWSIPNWHFRSLWHMCAFCSMITTLLPNRRTRAPSHNIDAKYAQNAVHYYIHHHHPPCLHIALHWRRLCNNSLYKHRKNQHYSE